MTRLESTWRPGRMWGAWLRAEWIFLFGGLGLVVLNGMAWSFYESGAAWWRHPFLESAARGCLTALQAIYDSVWRNLFFVALMAGPVFLMVKTMTPGMHASLRLFGIRRCPIQRKTYWATVLAGFSLVIAWFILSGLVTVEAGWFDPRDAWSRTFEPAWEGILYGCIVAPFVEEFLFRGFIFGSLRTRWHPGLAAAASSLLFALTHAYSPAGTVDVMLFGLLMCALYHRTGTLLVPMTIHALTNLLFATAA